MTKKEAYNIVFWDLMNIPLYKGKYDAEVFRNREYMCGIGTVMETISFGADPDYGSTYEIFKELFRLNMKNSEAKAKEN